MPTIVLKARTSHMHTFTEELEIIVAMVSEANLVGNPLEWIVDIGTSRHIY